MPNPGGGLCLARLGILFLESVSFWRCADFFTLSKSNGDSCTSHSRYCEHVRVYIYHKILPTRSPLLGTRASVQLGKVVIGRTITAHRQPPSACAQVNKIRCTYAKTGTGRVGGGLGGSANTV